MEKEMEIYSAEREMNRQQQTDSRSRKGGLVTMPFIIANEAFEKLASFGLSPNMILYLIKEYKMGVTKGTNILFYWNAATNFMPLFGAFLSDSYLGRFLTIALGCIISLLGMILLWMTAMIPQARPPSCNQLHRACKSATPGQYAMLISSFALMSIGAGGIRPCSLAFGADQFDDREKSTNKRVLERFFSWYYVSSGFSVLIAFMVIVYIQDHVGWKVGFGIPASLMFLSTVVFFIASPLYIKHKANKSLFTSLAQVVVGAFRNRKLAFPTESSSRWFHHKDSALILPTNKLRFLNKACVLRNPEDNITPDGVPSNPWRLCTVEQVEELKALIRVIPLWSTGIMISVNFSQGSFPVLQARSMDRHITSGFQIPAGSLGMFLIIIITVWIVLYDRVIIPLASKIRGKPVYLEPKTRMGLGIFFSGVSMVASAIVEQVRRRKAIQEGFENNPQGVVNMSAMWLVTHQIFSALAEAFNLIGQQEFYYSELPKSMSSIATALSGLAGGVASLLASVILSTVNKITRGEGKEGWLASNINRGHYDYYYWLLAVLSFINLLYFLLCSWAYGPCGSQGTKVRDEGKNWEEKELAELETGVTNGRDGIIAEQPSVLLSA